MTPARLWVQIWVLIRPVYTQSPCPGATSGGAGEGLYEHHVPAVGLPVPGYRVQFFHFFS